MEGNLKDNFRHVYSRRVFYIDEDTKGIVATEIYDGRGQLWRVQELGGGVQYELPLCGGSGDTVYDLMVGRYLMLGLIMKKSRLISMPTISMPIATPGQYSPPWPLMGRSQQKFVLARFCRLPFDA